MEPRNIVDDDPQERVSAEAAILNSRVHYYGRLTGSSDRLLVRPLTLAHVQVISGLWSHAAALRSFRCCQTDQCWQLHLVTLEGKEQSRTRISVESSPFCLGFNLCL